MAERALAHVEKIEWIKPIEGADNIELIGVLGWECIAKKGEFNVGDLAVYIEVDSKCNEKDERFAFLESKHYKIKIMKLGKFKVYSQGIALPLSLFPELTDKPIGSDVTKELGVTYSSEEDAKRKTNKVDPETKYKNMKGRHPNVFKNPVVKKIMKYKAGRRVMFLFFGKKKDNPKGFPNWIVKTDESRIENCPFYLKSEDKWIKTEKLDGTSCTYALDIHRANRFWQKDDFEYIVCSRNVRQMDRDQKTYHDTNIYWELYDKYNIQNVLARIAEEYYCDRVVIQGEGVGFVQGNPYKMKENDLYVFNVILDGKRMGSVSAKKLVESYGMKFVPIIDESYEIPHSMEEMKMEADGCSAVNPKVKREGFVYRSIDGKDSFKNVSREYMLKHS